MPFFFAWWPICAGHLQRSQQLDSKDFTIGLVSFRACLFLSLSPISRWMKLIPLAFWHSRLSISALVVVVVLPRVYTMFCIFPQLSPASGRRRGRFLPVWFVALDRGRLQCSSNYAVQSLEHIDIDVDKWTQSCQGLQSSRKDLVALLAPESISLSYFWLANQFVCLVFIARSYCPNQASSND